MKFGQLLNSHRIFKRIAMAQIRLLVCAGWFEPLRFKNFLFIVTPNVGVCNCSMFCCTLLYIHSTFAIILMSERELVDLLILSPWCLVMAAWLFLAVPWSCLRFVIVVFPDHTHLLFCWSHIPHCCKSHVTAPIIAQIEVWRS